jgi:protein TIF31
MVIRSFKHIIRAVIAAVDDMQIMSAAIAETLNILLGSPRLENGADTDAHIEHNLRLKWVECFLSKRFCWKMKDEFAHLRKFIILRGLCSKVWYIEMGSEVNHGSITVLYLNRYIDMVCCSGWTGVSCKRL